jgi:PKD repeat protein
VSNALVCNANSSFTFNSSANSFNFVSTSTGTSGTSTYLWNYGDGTTGTGSSVSHTYANDGLYYVYLVVSDATPASCVDSSSMNMFVCTATNNISATMGANGLVNFMTSAPASTVSYYSWTFGDGGVLNGPAATASSPAHTYLANGNYLVNLIYQTAAGCTVSAQYTLTISNIANPCNLNAGFTSTSGANNSVNFTNTSTGTSGGVTYIWNFGDGNTSTSVSPSHTYATSGNYNVTLFANNNFTYTCQDSVYASVSATCVANASFTLTPSGTPQYWNAYVNSPGNIASALWTWGDGTTSNVLFTSHTYPAAGMYTICLTVTTTCGSIGNYCWAYNIYKSAEGNESQEVVHVNVVDASAVGIKNNEAESVAFNVAPNPSNGAFRLNLTGVQSGNASVKVYNLVGQEVYSSTVESVKGSFTKDVQLEQVANGVYFVKVNVNGQTATKKIVVSNN